jgi:aminoglycoside phosphotransferase
MVIFVPRDKRFIHLKPRLQLKGRSGCRVELLEREGDVVVRKYSGSPSYNNRLMLQAAKQQSFRDGGGIGGFDCPAVLRHHDGGGDGLAWYEMEYVHAERYSDYLERMSVEQLKGIAQQLIAYFDRTRSSSKVECPDRSIFENKLLELRARIKLTPSLDGKTIKDVFDFLSAPPNEKLYVGFCHGDFTLSNILFTHERLYLIDFLDTFIESPLQDIVKLRQDTCHRWIMMIDQELPLHRLNKMSQIFGYIDRLMIDYIEEDKVLRNWYRYFQAFNLARILPYLVEDEEIIFVQNNLRSLL